MRIFSVSASELMCMYNILELLTAEDIKKLEIIKGSVLKSTENRERRKERVKKYLSWVSMCYQLVVIFCKE